MEKGGVEKRCPLTYGVLTDGEELYSGEGLRRLAPKLERLELLPGIEEIRDVVRWGGRPLSISGVQSKLGANLRVAEGRFDIEKRASRYILKPAVPHWPELPANEDLTMRLAAAAGVEVPVHGLLHVEGGGFCYVVRRFDRSGRARQSVEDFGQLLGYDRDRKYDGTMEKVADAVLRYCTFPAVEAVRLFRRLLVIYLTGNEDMHLKNFSVITQDGITRLSPAYDLVNSTILLDDPEELALPLRGKRRRLKRADLVDYFARERLGLNDRTIASVEEEITAAFDEWDRLIDASFLSPEMRERYRGVVEGRKFVVRSS